MVKGAVYCDNCVVTDSAVKNIVYVGLHHYSYQKITLLSNMSSPAQVVSNIFSYRLFNSHKFFYCSLLNFLYYPYFDNSL